VIAILIASYFIARTPDGVFGERIMGSELSEDREEVAFSLEEGVNAGDIGEQLEELGIIRSGRQFELLAGLMGIQGQLSAGDFLLQKNSSTLTILNQLTARGEVVELISVTFPEGTRFEEMAVLAEEAGFGTRQEFLDAV